MKWFKPEKMSKGLYHKYLEEALGSFPENRETIRSAWRCPSNIALVKYWGKKPKQIPANPSLSFTLSNSYTEMTLTASRCAGKDPELEYFFEGVKNEAFETRIRGYLSNINACFPFLSGCDLRIESHNTFPHSSGIASSASSMGALALGICSIEQQLRDGDKDEEFYRKASYMARLASGSAARSVYGGFVTWGKQEGFEFTSDEFATPMMENAGPAL